MISANRFTLLLSILLLPATLSAQLLKLSVSHPAPRVGDELSVSFSIESNATESSQKGMIGLGAITLLPVFLSEPGQTKIGPMSIKFNNQVYKTDSLIVQVAQPLPPEVRDGIWIRQVLQKPNAYIIVEQRQSSPDRKFAALEMAKIEQQGIAITLESSQQLEQPTLMGAVQYKISIYKVNLPSGKVMKLDKRFFTNLPNNAVFE